MKNYSDNLISKEVTIKEALIRLNTIITKDQLTLFVLDKDQALVGTVTDGDIRRGLIGDKNINDPVSSIMHTNFGFLQKNSFTLEEIEWFKKKEIKLVPLVDENKKILRIIDLSDKFTVLPIDAVILAGGRGERLMPLTEKTPKPLLKIGNKPILEHNIDRLKSYGVDKFTLAIRYLGDQIVDYFGNGDNKDINISYVKENGTPLGTIGAVSKVENFMHDSILVMNADLLTNIDYEDFFKDFILKEADMIVATIPYKVQIPYAVLEIDNDRIVSFKEKPTYTYYSNAGIYIIKRDLLKLIPKNEFFNATDFIDKLISKGSKVVYYPILSYWLDIGKHEDYKKAQSDIKYIRL